MKQMKKNSLYLKSSASSGNSHDTLGILLSKNKNLLKFKFIKKKKISKKVAEPI